jgi:histidinol phosphatase-like enzyme (inositol monophosphatase family)
MSDFSERLILANKIAIAAGKLTLKYFQTDQFEVQHKGDGSPLTIADQESERFLRDEISKAFPDDGIVGEEFGVTEGTSDYGWILDPIDGTKSFISGVPLYGTMVGVERKTEDGNRQSIIGAIYFPGLDVGMYAERGCGAWSFEGDQEAKRAQVSKKSDASKSVMLTTSVQAFNGRGPENCYDDIANQFYYCRTWGDVYGYYLVAIGRAEVMIDPVLNVWDAAAVQPIIEEAGGKFTDWNGVECIDGGSAVGSNGLMHELVIDSLKSS